MCLAGVKEERVGYERLVVGRGRSFGEVVGTGRCRGFAFEALGVLMGALDCSFEVGGWHSCFSSYLEERGSAKVGSWAAVAIAVYGELAVQAVVVLAYSGIDMAVGRCCRIAGWSMHMDASVVGWSACEHGDPMVAVAAAAAAGSLVNSGN